MRAAACGAALATGVLAAASTIVGIVATSELPFPRWVPWLLVVGGAPPAALFAIVAAGRWWRAAALFAGTVVAVAIGLSSLPTLPWPTDLARAGAPTLRVFAVYVAAGLAVAIATARLRPRLARRARWLASAALAVLAIATLLRVGYYVREHGLLPFAHGGRVAAYDRLWTNLARYYARWEDPAVPLSALRAKYRAIVVAADDGCGYLERCPAYEDAIRDMLAELQDGHTHLVPRTSLAVPEVELEPIEGAAVVTRADDIPAGAVVRRIDGRTVPEALAAVPRHLTAFRAAHTRLRYAYANLLAGPRGTTTRIDVELPGGEAASFELRRTATPDRRAARLRGERLAGDVAYVAVPTLATADIVTAFDAWLDAQAPPRAVILDLRGNGGGWSRHGAMIVGRLIGEAVVYGRECFRGRHPMKGVTGCFDAVVEPRPAAFVGPLAVVIDGGVASSAEWMALALCSAGRARCFGTTTAGDSGNPVIHFLPDLMLQFSTGRFSMLDGRVLDGAGVTPHVVIARTRADVVGGRDPALDAAARWLTSR